jgi:uncharacterized membrane protein
VKKEKMENKKIKMDDEKQGKTEEEIKEIVRRGSPLKVEYVLLEKTKALYTMLIPQLNFFPKDAKFVLRVKIEESVINIIRYLILKNYAENDIDRRKVILQVVSEIHILAILLQQAVIFKYISYRNYENIAELTKEISAMSISQYKNLGGKNENL